MKRLIALALVLITAATACYAQTQGRLPGVLFPSDRGPRSYATLQAQLTAVSTLPYTFVLDRGTWTITSDLSIPATVALKLLPGAVLNISAGKNLEILGSFDAPAETVFTGSGTASGPAVFPYRIPEWGSTTQYDIGDGYLRITADRSDVTTNAWTWISPTAGTVQASLDDLDTAILPAARVSIATNGLHYVTNVSATAQIAVSNLDAAVSSLNSVVTNNTALIATNTALLTDVTEYLEVTWTNTVSTGSVLGGAMVGINSGSTGISVSGSPAMTNAFDISSGLFRVPRDGVYSVTIIAGGSFIMVGGELGLQAAWSPVEPPLAAEDIGRYGTSSVVSDGDSMYVWSEGSRIMRLAAGQPITSGWYVEGALGVNKVLDERRLMITYVRDLQ